MRTAILLSGGMDSIALAAWKRPQVAITIDYGQAPFTGECRAASKVAEELGIEHHILHADCRALGSGDLAGCEPDPLAPASEWWPFRNQYLTTVAAMFSVRIGVRALMLGTVKSDDFHADGSPPFINAIDSLCKIQEGGLRVTAPAIHLTAAELVRASEVGIRTLAWAHSCHKADFACGLCRGCEKHQAVMEELGYGRY